MFKNFIRYYNELRKGSGMFNHLEDHWVCQDDDPELEDFMDKNPYAKYFNGYGGIYFMKSNKCIYRGFYVETPTGFGITEFSSLTSSDDEIRDRMSIPAIYEGFELICFNESTDEFCTNRADCIVGKHKSDNLYDMYLATSAGLKLIIKNAKIIKVAEKEIIYDYFPDCDDMISPPTSKLDLMHTHTKVKSLIIEKDLNPTLGKKNPVISSLYYGEHWFWEASFHLCFWQDEPDAKYSMKYAIEHFFFNRFKSCLDDSVCRLGKLKDSDPYICSECMEKGIINVQALISIEKLLNGEYLEEHKEYSDFFTEEVLNLKKPE